MAELVYDKSPCKCSCHVSCFVCVLVSFCVCINDLASNQTKEKQNKAFIQFFLIFLILSSPCSCFFCLLLLFFLHHHSWDLTLPPQWESIPETPRSPRQTPSHSFTFTGGGGRLTEGFRDKKVFKSINNLRTQGSSSQSAAGCVHTYHSYIISIIWHRKASKLTER